MLKIYGPLRSRAFRCRWLCEELDIPYDAIHVDLSTGEHRSEEFLRLNPLGRVPVMVEDGFVLSESSAICCYLADKYTDEKIIPAPRTKDRARFDQWMSYLLTEIDAALWNISKHAFVFPKDKRLPQMIEIGNFEFNRSLSLLSEQIKKQSYVMGNEFTLADLFAGHILMWARSSKINLEPHLQDYILRLRSRTAFEKTQAKAEAKFMETI